MLKKLAFFYRDRLVNVYSESPNLDYIKEFDKVIKELNED